MCNGSEAASRGFGIEPNAEEVFAEPVVGALYMLGVLGFPKNLITRRQFHGFWHITPGGSDRNKVFYLHWKAQILSTIIMPTFQDPEWQYLFEVGGLRCLRGDRVSL